jgi:hypothetical protein
MSHDPVRLVQDIRQRITAVAIHQPPIPVTDKQVIGFIVLPDKLIPAFGSLDGFCITWAVYLLAGVDIPQFFAFPQ